MLETPDHKTVLVIVGPTGIGKSDLAIELARQVNGEIISADSRYLYRGMNIGTAKPTFDQLDSVIHHLVDVAEPDECWSLARFLKETRKKVNEIHRRKRIPILTGGTGQYIRALTEGWRVPEFETDQKLRRVLNQWGQSIGAIGLHEKLRLLDKKAADFIDASNMRRTVRALEVIFTTGKRFSDCRRKDGPAYDFRIIGLRMEREKLYERIDARIDHMIAAGLEEEVRNLLIKGYGADLPAMSAIGYREMARFINGEIDLESAKALMRKNTRNLVRRQANWFKSSNPEIRWYETGEQTTIQVLDDLAAAGIWKKQ